MISIRSYESYRTDISILVDIPPTNLFGWKFENIDVCYDQSTSGPPERDLDKLEICNKGKFRVLLQ